jgi:hypothetical protein
MSQERCHFSRTSRRMQSSSVKSIQKIKLDQESSSDLEPRFDKVMKSIDTET